MTTTTKANRIFGTINNGENQIHIIDLDQISLEKSFMATGEWVNESTRKPGWNSLILKVAGAGLNYAGYSIGFIPEGFGGRQVTGGNIVPGPWAFASARATVIDRQGGTRTELARATTEGRTVEAKLGDYLLINGSGFRIDKTYNGNIKLVAAEPPATDEVNAEGAMAERRCPNM